MLAQLEASAIRSKRDGQGRIVERERELRPRIVLEKEEEVERAHLEGSMVGREVDESVPLVCEALMILHTYRMIFRVLMSAGKGVLLTLAVLLSRLGYDVGVG